MINSKRVRQAVRLALATAAGSAVPLVVLAQATPAETRTGDVGNLDAMMKAKQPGWVAVANPFVGLAGVLLGARLRRPTAAA